MKRQRLELEKRSKSKGLPRRKFSRISNAGERAIKLLAVDANCILSSVIGGKSRLIFRKLESKTQFHTALPMFGEVLEYIPVLALKKGIAIGDAFTALQSLTLEVHDPGFYKETYSEAWKRMHDKDPDDVPLLALALKLNCPIWTNNVKDFRDCGVEFFTTEKILKMLNLIS